MYCVRLVQPVVVSNCINEYQESPCNCHEGACHPQGLAARACTKVVQSWAGKGKVLSNRCNISAPALQQQISPSALQCLLGTAYQSNGLLLEAFQSCKIRVGCMPRSVQ